MGGAKVSFLKAANPRMNLCWDFYTDPESDSFGNAAKSGRKAGYTDQSADQVSMQAWFQARVRKTDMLDKAEKVLGNMLDMDEEDEQVFEGKKTGVKVRTAAIVKIKQDTAKYVTERIGKESWAAQSGVDVTVDGMRLTEEDTANLLKTLACGSTKRPADEGADQKEAADGIAGNPGDTAGHLA